MKLNRRKALVGFCAASLISPAKAILGSVPPTDNLQLWLDATQPMWTNNWAAQCVSSADQVYNWPSRSPNGPTGAANGSNIYVPVSAVGGITGAPHFAPTGINGSPAVFFNGNSALFRNTGWLSGIFDRSMSLYIVGSSPNNTLGLMCASGVTSSGKYFYLGRTTTRETSGQNGLSITGFNDNTIRSPDGVSSFVYDGANAIYQTRDGTYAQLPSSGFDALAGESVNYQVPVTGPLGLNGLDFVLGGFVDGSFLWPGYIGEVLLYATAHPPGLQKQIRDYLSAKWGFNNKTLINCIGNSRTAGAGSTSGGGQNCTTSGDNYPSLLYSALGAANCDVFTTSHDGYELAGLIGVAGRLNGMCWPTARKNIAVIWALLNDTESVPATYNTCVQFGQMLKVMGYKVIICTDIGIYSPASQSYPQQNSDIAILNSLVKANYLTGGFGDAICDLAAIGGLIPPAADGTHFTTAQYALVATAVEAALAPFL